MAHPVELPGDSWRCVMQHLNPTDLVSAARASRQWRSLASDQHLWFPHFQGEFSPDLTVRPVLLSALSFCLQSVWSKSRVSAWVFWPDLASGRGQRASQMPSFCDSPSFRMIIQIVRFDQSALTSKHRIQCISCKLKNYLQRRS
jgi:hypothetical protein